MQLGFIGTGAITTALVTGLCTTKSTVASISVSPRSEDKSRQLQEQFPQVQIGASNQAVVDESDVVVLAFLPNQKEKILNHLKFRENQTILHLLAGTRISQVAPLINANCTVIRSVPLPCATNHIGPIAVYPSNQTVEELLIALGTVINVDKEEELESLSVITALMAPYFEMVANVVDWAVDSGVNQKQAADYSASMFEALSVLAKDSPNGDLHQLAIESMTPGGLNELAMKVIDKEGGYSYLKSALQAVTKRVMGPE